MLLETIKAAGIGYTSFTHYPTTDGEENALRPTVPINYAKYKTTDLIVRCNERQRQQSIVRKKSVTVELPLFMQIKEKIQTHIDEDQKQLVLASSKPFLLGLIDPKKLEIPPMYQECSRWNIRLATKYQQTKTLAKTKSPKN
jgi:hypothetical protein